MEPRGYLLILELYILALVYIYFRCKKPSYYAVTLGLAVIIWVAFRFGLNVDF